MHRSTAVLRACVKTERMFDIGDVVFSQVPEEEKVQYSSKLKEEGTRIGYKPRELFVRPPGYLIWLDACQPMRDLVLDDGQRCPRPTRAIRW